MNKIIEFNLRDNYRLVVVSDIHGGIDLFEELLVGVNLEDEDYLIVIGDFLQRGYSNRSILDKMISLSKRPRTYILSGNHEHYLVSLLEKKYIDRFRYHLNEINYGCILDEWIKESKFDINDYEELQNKIKKRYKSELDFLRNLPHALKINNHIFVHSGIEDIDEWKDSSVRSLLSTERFLDKKHRNSAFVVVGHWPIFNYSKDSLNGNILIDEDKRIIAIDGGYGVKTTGQLNALLINYNGDYSYEKKAFDNSRLVKVLEDIETVNHSVVKLDWFDSEYELLEKRNEFSLCKKLSTNEEFLLKNEFIKYQDGKYSIMDDYVSLFLNLKCLDEVGLIEYYGEYALVRYKGEVGWVEKRYLSD